MAARVPSTWPQAVVEACDEPSTFEFCYPLDASLKEKIESIATKIYGAGNVTYSPAANTQLARYEKNGFGGLPDLHRQDPSVDQRRCIVEGCADRAHVERARGAGIGRCRLHLPDLRRHDARCPASVRRPAASIIDFDEHGEIVGLS